MNVISRRYAVFMYPDLLQQIAAEQRSSGASPQSPCSGIQLDQLKRRARVELGTDLPAGYVDFLAHTDGLDWNGVVIYASEPLPIVRHPDRLIAGVVEMNLIFRDDRRFDDLLVLGSDGLDIYTYRVSTGAYEVRDEVPHELVAEGLSFEELMTKALRRSLDRPD